MTAMEIIGTVQAITLFGIWYRLGGLTERIKALEEWRKDVRISHKSAA